MLTTVTVGRTGVKEAEVIAPAMLGSMMQLPGFAVFVAMLYVARAKFDSKLQRVTVLGHANLFFIVMPSPELQLCTDVERLVAAPLVDS